MAEEILVGDPGCTFNEVCKFITTYNLKDTVIPEIPGVGLSLGIPKHKVDTANTKILLKLDQPISALMGFLEEWRQTKHREATLENLCKAFRENGLAEFATQLEAHFVGVRQLSNHETATDRHDGEVMMDLC